MLNVTPYSFVSLRPDTIKGRRGVTVETQPRAAYLVDVVAAVAGIHTSDARKALEALEWLDMTGRIARVEDRGSIPDVMADRLTLSRWAMVELLRHAPVNQKTMEIRERLHRLYSKHGNEAEAMAVSAG